MPETKFRIEEQKVQPDRVVGRVLRTLPEYFGFESAIVDYCENARRSKYQTFAAVTDDQKKVGFAMLTMNNSMTAEIWVMGVIPEFSGMGIGSALIKRMETETRKQGRKFLMAKTIGPSQNDANFLKTFNFYIHNGFLLLAEVDYLWAGDYCALLLKPIE